MYSLSGGRIESQDIGRIVMGDQVIARTVAAEAVKTTFLINCPISRNVSDTADVSALSIYLVGPGVVTNRWPEPRRLHSKGEKRTLDYPTREAALIKRQIRSIHLINRRSILPCVFF